jgi:conjugal transfer pilus assembly protein TrbC
MVRRLLYSILACFALSADAQDKLKVLDSKSLIQQMPEPTISDSLKFRSIAEAANKRMENEAEFYEALVAKANTCQAQHTEEISKLTNIKDSLIDQIIANHKNIERLEDRTKGLIVFVSFSMPQELLWNYYTQVKKLGGRMVMRGLFKNSFKKTIQKMRLDEKRAVIMDINPKLFEEYQIHQVPSIVVSDGKVFDKFVGSVTIQYALNAVGEQGDVNLLSTNLLEGIRK